MKFSSVHAQNSEPYGYSARLLPMMAAFLVLASVGGMPRIVPVPFDVGLLTVAQWELHADVAQMARLHRLRDFCSPSARTAARGVVGVRDGHGRIVAMAGLYATPLTLHHLEAVDDASATLLMRALTATGHELHLAEGLDPRWRIASAFFHPSAPRS